MEHLEKVNRAKCKRSRTVLLVKNIPYSTTHEQLKDVFERHGVTKRIQLSPFNTLAIVEYSTPEQAKAGLKNLQNYELNFIMPLYLEFAPLGVFDQSMEQGKKEE